LPRIFLECILGQVWRSVFYFALELMVALPYHTAVLAVGVPHLGTEPLSAITAENSTGKRTLRRGATCGFLSPAKLSLYHIPRFGIDDGGIAVFHIILRNLALVDLHLLGEVVGGEGLLKSSIALVLFVCKNAFHGADLPSLLLAVLNERLSCPWIAASKTVTPHIGSPRFFRRL